ncbi:MAG: cysteine hydrolase family protein [Pseudolactococcus laudensis]|uniref:cysteine hydrolase family protein n=1 Tax=Pseudolactococcus laudensis TaxID=1494461 RepID=UPI003F963A03|nr:cysteine hydrolase [Lactococcus sp.]MBR2764225.1 cysteine hydrolase [Lactococcus sp.]
MTTALLVIDLQNGVGPLFGFEKVIQNVNQRIREYRENGDAIIFIQHNSGELKVGSEPWRFVSELDIKADDSVIAKTQANAFYQTDLKQTLDSLDIDSLEICGAQTEYCIDATVKAAYYAGYQIAVTPNAFSTVDTQEFPASKINKFYWGLWSWLRESSPLV